MNLSKDIKRADYGFTRYGIFIILPILMYACCKPIFYSETLITNNSTHAIELIPYKDGVELTQQAISCNTSETKKIYGDGGVSLFDTLDADSIYVVFDNAYKNVHYSHESSKTSNNPDVIKVTDVRSLFNVDSYIHRIKEQTKCASGNEYTYTFTEQDYLDAT